MRPIMDASESTDGGDKEASNVRTKNGAREATIGTHSDVLAQIELGATTLEEGELTVKGHAYDEGDDPEVTVTLSVENAISYLSLRPDAARKFAEDLETAADAAEVDVSSEEDP